MENETIVEATESAPKKTSKKKVEKFETLCIGMRSPEVRKYKEWMFSIYGAYTTLGNEFNIMDSIYTKKAQESLVLPITGMADERTYKGVQMMAEALKPM